LQDLDFFLSRTECRDGETVALFLKEQAEAQPVKPEPAKEKTGETPQPVKEEPMVPPPLPDVMRKEDPPIEEPRRQISTKTRPVRFIYPSGIGDALFAAAMGYAAVESGRAVSLQGKSYERDHPQSGATLEKLNCLSMFERKVSSNAQILPLLDIPEFQWSYGAPMLDRCLSTVGIPHGTTPRMGVVLAPPREDAITLVGQRPYAIIGPVGHSGRKMNEMTMEQVAVICTTLHKNNLRPVVVNTTPMPGLPASALDMTGKTSLQDVVALIAHAEIVVSVDCGCLHLAQALRRPTCAVTGPTITPKGFPDYRPILWCQARPDAAAVNIEEITKAIERLLKVTQAKWAVLMPQRSAPQNVDGVVETAQIMAEACGIPFLWTNDPRVKTLDFATCEYIESDEDNWRRWGNPDGLPLLAVLHTRKGAEVLKASAWAAWSKTVSEGLRRATVLNLPARQTQSATDKLQSMILCWHGMPSASKGLLHLLDTYYVARQDLPALRLRIVASTGNGIASQEILQVLKMAAIKDKRIEILTRDKWDFPDLWAKIAEADAHVFLTNRDAEQSAAVTTALGTGRPVIVNDSTCFDHVRPWCAEAGHNPAKTVVELFENTEKYARASRRAAFGASYRTPEIVGREYRAAAQQMILSVGGPTEYAHTYPSRD